MSVTAVGAHPGSGAAVWWSRPYEHHSNELPWRESIADVVVIPEDADGISTWPTCASS